MKLPRELLRLLLRDTNMLGVYLVCLDRARYVAGPELRSGRRVLALNVGQLVVGRKELALAVGISEEEARGALRRLKTLGIITSESTSLGTTITLCRYGEIDDDDSLDSPTDPGSKPPTDPQRTPSASPADPQRFTTNKKGKRPRRSEGQQGERREVGSRPDYSKVPVGMGGT